MYTAIGRLAVVWAVLETILDIMILLFMAVRPITGVPDRRQPVSLNRKLAYLKKVFRSDPIPQTLRVEGEAIIARIMVAKEARHDLIHGLAQGLVSEDRFGFKRALHREGRSAHRTTTYRLADMRVLVKDAEALQERCMVVLEQLYAPLMEPLKNLISDVASGKLPATALEPAQDVLKPIDKDDPTRVH